jgi:Family of unknown function (DUF5670)
VGTYLQRRRRPIQRQALLSALIRNRRQPLTLWTIFAVLLVLWLLGLVSGYAFGGLIHILLVVAVIVLVINLLQGRRVA